MDYAVHVIRVEEQLLAAARNRTSIARVTQDIQRLLVAPWRFVKGRPGLWQRGYNVAVYWNGEADDAVEVGVQVVARFDPTELVVCSATPAGTVATATHFGPYSELGGAHHAVREWCRQNNRACAGPYWEIYGHWDEDPAKVRTDVLYLLR